MTPLRFDAATHTYTCPLTGRKLPNISLLLKLGGEVDDTWFTEESCYRGTVVHDLTKAYDLGALDPKDCVSEYRGYLLAYVAASNVVRPRWKNVEVAWSHPKHRFAGRPDRDGLVYGTQAVGEIKSGGEEDAHRVQTALQAILVAPGMRLAPEMVQRFAFYVDREGRYAIRRHHRRVDYTKAYDLIRRFA